MANEKDPSAPLGMTIRETAFLIFFHPATEANLRPFGAPPSIGRRENHALVPSHQHSTKKKRSPFGLHFLIS